MSAVLWEAGRPLIRSSFENPCTNIKNCVFWQGRKVGYIVITLLVGTGLLGIGSGGYAFLKPDVELSAPSWMIGICGIILAFIVCLGACCLCIYLPCKNPSDHYLLVQNDIERMQNETNEKHAATQAVRQENATIVVDMNDSIDAFINAEDQAQSEKQKRETDKLIEQKQDPYYGKV